MDYHVFYKIGLLILIGACVGLYWLKNYVRSMYSDQATTLEYNLLRFFARVLNWTLGLTFLLLLTFAIYVNYLDYLRTSQ